MTFLKRKPTEEIAGPVRNQKCKIGVYILCHGCSTLCYKIVTQHAQSVKRTHRKWIVTDIKAKLMYFNELIGLNLRKFNETLEDVLLIVPAHS